VKAAVAPTDVEDISHFDVVKANNVGNSHLPRRSIVSYLKVLVLACFAFLCASCENSGTGVQASSQLVTTGTSGFLKSSRPTAEIVSSDATYRLVDAYSNQTVGSLEFSNGWAIERSDKYPSVINNYHFGAFSTPYSECRGTEQQRKDFGAVYSETTALCRSLRSFDVKAQGYSGGRYDFKGVTGDLFFFSQSEGQLPTIYRLKHIE